MKHIKLYEQFINEAQSKFFTDLLDSGDLALYQGPKTTTRKFGESFWQLNGDSKDDMIIFELKGKRYGVVAVRGADLPTELLKSLGFSEVTSFTKGVEAYGYDEKSTPHYISEKDMEKLVIEWRK
jgi:hypothetical protein